MNNSMIFFGISSSENWLEDVFSFQNGPFFKRLVSFSGGYF